ncbi:MAG TPA: hypothetical protein VKB34_20595 [Povalibacter sp.]|nr:hypothetical protein [Povalibacter sp.]
MAAQMNRSRWMVGLGLVVTASFTLPAVAEPPAASSSSSSSGLMSFPNVRVVNAPPAQATKATTAPAASEGMRAAIDPETGRLRQLTAEEAQALSPAAKKAAVSGVAARRATVSSESTTTDAGQTLYGPGNAVGLTLGDEAQVYQVAHKTDQGLEITEHAGRKAAEAAISKNAQKQEVKNAR